jgi:ribosome-associated toxin RatA of RatAB toxin-antitoxin module
MDTVTAFVPCDADACWQVFTDVGQLTSWVPGLRAAHILSKERGLPAEIHFEFASARAYTLVYSYDRARREVRWQPKLGKHEGVTGFVRFEPEADGTRITYGLEHGDARTDAERELGDPKPAIEAFANRMRGS